MSTHNIGFYEDLTKIISSNKHLISLHLVSVHNTCLKTNGNIRLSETDTFLMMK